MSKLLVCFVCNRHCFECHSPCSEPSRPTDKEDVRCFTNQGRAPHHSSKNVYGLSFLLKVVSLHCHDSMVLEFASWCSCAPTASVMVVCCNTRVLCISLLRHVDNSINAGKHMNEHTFLSALWCYSRRRIIAPFSLLICWIDVAVC